jgi:hypothetical protein
VYDARVRDEPITTRARTMSPSLPAWLTSRPKALGARRGVPKSKIDGQKVQKLRPS